MIQRKTILLILLALTIATAPLKAVQYPGCTEIDWHNNSTNCISCYKRKLLPDRKGCGPILPESDPCLIYTQDQHPHREHNFYCGTCKTGYALNVSSSATSDDLRCVKSSTPGCVQKSIVPWVGTLCNVCSDRKFAAFNYTSEKYECQESKKEIQRHCLWGGELLSRFVRGTSCFRCDEGYSLSQRVKKCEPTRQKGCLKHYNSICVTCDYYAGYSMDSEGNCFKDSTLDGNWFAVDYEEGSEDVPNDKAVDL